ncbi:MAG TPA: MFS transporter [Acidimicrobiia bacterium]|nr:MFS transporter [Acidimicrobiia bacterium]
MPPTSVLSRELLPASIAIYTTVALAAFEGLAVSAALPQVAADLGDVHLLPWMVTGYLLMSGVAAVVAGPLVDSYGVRAVFRTAIIVFVTGAVLASTVSSMPLMVAARLLHGAGGGAIIAVGIAAVSLIYPAPLIGRAFAANATVWGVMGVAGPGIAAFMLTTLNWRWIFLVNIPLGLLALAAGWRVMPHAVDRAHSRRIDVPGVIGVLALNTFLLLAVDTLGVRSLLWLAGAVVTGGLLWVHIRRTTDPIMRIRHLATQPFATLAVSLALLVTGAVAMSSFLTLYVRGGRGASELLTAWSVFFFVIGWTLGANLSSRLLDRMAETSVIGVGFALTTPGLALLGVGVTIDAPLPVILGLMVLTAAGVGLGTNAGLTLLRAVSDPSEIGRSSAAHQFFRNQGFTLGAAMGGAVILAVVATAVGDVEAVRDVLASDAIPNPTVSAAIRDGYAAAAFTGFGVVASGLVPFLALRRHLAPARATRAARAGS